MKKFLLNYLIQGFENKRLFTEAFGPDVGQAADAAHVQLMAYWGRFMERPFIAVLHHDFSKDRAIVAMLRNQPRYAA